MATNWIRKIIKEAIIFRNLSYNPILQKIVFKIIRGKKNVTTYVCDNILSEYKDSYLKSFAKYYKIRKERKRDEKK
jgi:hypothetical protein